MKKIKKVAIIGMGALGIMYGQKMTEAGVDLVFLGDTSRIEKLHQSPISCNGKLCDFKMIDPYQTKIKADLVLFAVKATQLDEAIKLASQVIRPDTILCSVLNGISSEEIIEEKLKHKKIIKCVVQGMDAVKINQEMSYQNLGFVCMGITLEELDKKEALLSLKAFFDDIHLPYVIEDDINHRLWSKWMLNIGVNQVVMIKEGTYATIQKEGEAREMMKAAMQEVIQIAQASNILLTQEDFETYLKIVDSLNPKGMPSMRQDGLARRTSEVEFFSGALIKKAHALNMNVPINEMLYTTIKRLEKEYI